MILSKAKQSQSTKVDLLAPDEQERQKNSGAAAGHTFKWAWIISNICDEVSEACRLWKSRSETRRFELLF